LKPEYFEAAVLESMAFVVLISSHQNIGQTGFTHTRGTLKIKKYGKI
jgi:hypothetical protein